MMNGVLVVVSGLPGSGKSTLADALGQRLRAPVLSVDPIEAAIWRCGITPSFETGVAAYEVALYPWEEYEEPLSLDVPTLTVDTARAYNPSLGDIERFIWESTTPYDASASDVFDQEPS